MATQGVNLFLSGIGTEAVWQKWMEKYGYSFAEIQKFIPGPAYTAWWLMGNLEGEGGPVSQEYINGRVELQKKIIARAKELGMNVVLQGFAGFVPSTIGSKGTGVTVHDQGDWVGGYKRPVVVSGPKAIEMAKTWYEESVKLFGAAGFYGGDLFHEGGNIPSNLDVSKYAGDIQAEMMKVNPEAVWVLQSWLGNPHELVLKGLKKDQALVIDLGNERDFGWLRHQPTAFTGVPWVFSVIQNFGARMGIYGRIPAIADRYQEMRNNARRGNNWGIGIAPEAIIFNQASYDIMWDMVWESARIDPQNFITRFAGYRYGKNNANAENAWKILLNTALNCPGGSTQDGASESVIGARPRLDVGNVSSWSTTKLYYDPKAIIPAWTLMVNSAQELKDQTTFRFDLVDLTRQNLSNYAQILQKEWADAFRAKNKALFTEKSKLFLELILDQDSLLRTRQECLTGPWIADARKIGTTESEKNLFERNARALITTWKTTANTSLNDYSFREWAGLMKDYYYKRWKLFIDDLAGQLDGKAAVNYDFYNVVEKLFQIRYTVSYPTSPQGDEIAVSKYMYEKYMPLFNGTQKRIYTISENQPKGTEVGTLNITGANTFELQGQSVTDAFVIDASTGKITVNKAEVMLQSENPTFTLRIKATNPANPSFAEYADVTINLTATSGIAENSYGAQVRLFPNPTRSSLTVQLPAEQRVQLTVSNEKGTILLQRQESGTEFLLDTINIAPGVYFLNIKSDFANNSYKFLVKK